MVIDQGVNVVEPDSCLTRGRGGSQSAFAGLPSTSVGDAAHLLDGYMG